MIAIGMALAWAGYAVGMYGYICVRGYDVPFSGLFGSVWPPGSAAGSGPASSTLPADPGTGIYNV